MSSVDKSNKKLSASKQDTCAQVMKAVSLQKKAKFWAFVSIVCLWYLLSGWINEPPSVSSLPSHIAQVDISGPLESTNDSWYRQLQLVEKSPNVESLVLIVDSPGGVVHVAEAGYKLLKRIHKKIPIVTVVENQSASAAYLLSCESDVIFAKETSVVGSIGVVSSIRIVKDFLANVGVKYETFGYGQDLSSVPFSGLTDFTKKYLYMAGNDSYTWFKNIVRVGRKLNSEQLNKVTEGRVFLGADALKLGLIDGFGNISEANHWLQTVHGINENNSLHFVNYDSFV